MESIIAVYLIVSCLTATSIALAAWTGPTFPEVVYPRVSRSLEVALLSRIATHESPVIAGHMRRICDGRYTVNPQLHD